MLHHLEPLLKITPLPAFLTIIIWRVWHQWYIVILLVVVLLIAMVLPRWYRVLERASTVFTSLINKIIFYVSLAIIYYLIITPLGFVRWFMFKLNRSSSNWSYPLVDKLFKWENSF